MNRHPANGKRRGAFTLIELLAVVVILTILLVLGFSTFRSIRLTAAKVECVKNLQHIYVSTLAFVSDYNGALPPDLGRSGLKEVNSRFTVAQYWWEQAYLGPYTTNKLNRKRDSQGAITEEEATALYRCPARLQDGQDSFWAQSSGKLGITYIMRSLGSGGEDKPNYLFRSIEGKSQKIFITEGRSSTFWAENAKTGEFGKKDESRRLRRYHNGALNILFLDGHVASFSDSDSAFLLKMKPEN